MSEIDSDIPPQFIPIKEFEFKEYVEEKVGGDNKKKTKEKKKKTTNGRLQTDYDDGLLNTEKEGKKETGYTENEIE